MNPKSVSPIFYEILRKRGIKTTYDIERFLNPSVKDLRDPFSIVQMYEACKIIEQLIYKKGKAFIYADGDVDGITGAAMLVNLFKHVGVSFDVRVTHRLEDYEIEPSFVDKLKQFGYEILITIDTGTSSRGLIEYCEENNFPLIIIDHHRGDIEDDFNYVTILNPSLNREDKDMDFLTASGLVFKLVQSLRSTMPIFDEDEFLRYIELAAIGTLGDYGLLIDENRLIVKLGLNYLESTRIFGLEVLRKYFYIPRKSGDIEPITRYLNPKLNTPGRFGKPELAFKILTANKDDELFPIFQEIERMEKEKQNIFRKLNNAISKANMNEPIFAIFEGIPCSFSGPVAARLSERVHAPAMVGIRKGEIIQGSARGYDNTDLYEFFRNHKYLFLSFGGHKNAVGFKLNSCLIKELQSVWKEIKVNSCKKKASSNDPIKVDFDTLTVPFIEALELLKPYGPGNPRVLFTTSNVQCLKITRYQQDKIVAWVKQNDKIFEAHFPKNFKMPSRLFSITFTPLAKKSNGFYVIWLDVKDCSEIL
ncbi:MAG: DHH family phosphoesterase [Candidatus Omnitrophica bacterium]|nr:DHH family phosphoesterase [Candidatus Omnitrophota bacterium]